MIRVLVADESTTIAGNISRRLGLESDIEVCGTVGDGETAVQEALRLRPDIAIVDAGLPGMDGGQTTEMLRQFVPGTGVIMMSMEAEKDAFRLAMLAGAREFLQKPFKGDDLVAAVRRVHEFELRAGGGPAVAVSAAAPAVTAPIVELPALPAEVDEPPHGDVTCVISGRGGVGKTVIAANLAVSLAAGDARRTALVDLSLQFGDIAATLNLTSERNIGDFVAADAHVDVELLDQVLIEGPGGVRVMLAPPDPRDAGHVSAAHVRTLLAMLRTTVDHVVLDLPSSIDDVALAALEAADHVVLVTDLSVPGVKNSRLLRGYLDALGVPPASVTVVGSHREATGELDRSGAESFLGTRMAVELPYEPRVVATSVAEGVPFVLRSPDSQASTSVRRLVALIDPASQNSGETHATAETADRKKRSRRMFGLTRAS